MLLIEGNDGKPHWAFWMNVYCVVLCIVDKGVLEVFRLVHFSGTG